MCFDHFETMLNASQTGIETIDLDRNIRYANLQPAKVLTYVQQAIRVIIEHMADLPQIPED
jgi:PAS domain-containing protein